MPKITNTVVHVPGVVADPYTPKWFSSTFTGSGKGTGMLNNQLSFNMNRLGMKKVTRNLKGFDTYESELKSRYVNGTIEIATFPVSPIPWFYFDSYYKFASEVPKAGFVLFTKVIDKFFKNHPEYLTDFSGAKTNAYGAIMPLQIQVRQDSNIGAKSREVMTQYAFFIQGHPTETVVFWVRHDEDVAEFLTNVTNYPIDTQKVYDYLQQTDLYQLLSRNVQFWTDNISEWLDLYCKTVMSTYPTKDAVKPLMKALHYWGQYKLELSNYQQLFNFIHNSKLAQKNKYKLIQADIHLLLFDTLDQLKAKESKLAHIKTPKPAPQIDPKFTLEQSGAISDESPLVLTQAGAGTGKSTTLLARIQYMKDCGIDPETITVLSFTNAGADNIKEKNPNIQSMTIAKMLHTVYTHNYEEHQLSTPETMVNAIKAFQKQFKSKTQDVAKRLIDGLYDARSAKPSGYSRLLQIVETNWDELVEILSRVRQITLELEIIIAYVRMDKMILPPEFKTKHLIIDEVQDNSLFEFIYALKFANKYETSLFMVGDSSQTLYEFRASNPKALNILEMTSYFSTHQLNINYRSNQEILDYANQFLQIVEANQFAQIQLQANDLKPVTKQSFQEAVTLDVHTIARQKDVDENLAGYLDSTDVRAFIDDKIAKDEKVAFLTHKGKHMKIMEQWLEQAYPNHEIANLHSNSVYTLSLFSQFVADNSDALQNVPVHQFFSAFKNMFAKSIQDYQAERKEPDKILQYNADRLLEYWEKHFFLLCDNIVIAWKHKTLTTNDAIQELIQLVLQCEIQFNGILQAVNDETNAEKKSFDKIQRSTFIVSTIHGAKGLEFDNVVILINENALSRQEDLRMYYVGLTRAQKAEYVIGVTQSRVDMLTTRYNALLDSYQ
jgi:DNA helicase-2/ATP-dependent DNA helicase PcrA